VNKNRIAVVSTATALLIGLAGCGSDDTGSPTPSSTAPGATGSLKASGSSAQKNAMAEWINGFQTANPGVTVDYQANGSGAGVQDFINAQTDFAGSDSALKPEEVTAAATRCGGNPAINIPMVGGAIALAYNIEGVDALVLNPATAAGIFTGTITKWNDPAIAALNPGATLPDATIASFHRSDSSGTTDNFTKWLIATAKDAYTFEGGKDWVAPGGQGAKGSDGVASAVASTANSIGYMELSFVQIQGLKAAQIDNGGGAVAATSDAAAKTIATASIAGQGNDLALKLDRTVADGSSYPIVLVTYEITCEKGLAAEQAALVKQFLTYTSSDEVQGALAATGYVPISGDLLTKVRASVAAIS
jgi:phosphate transport system substrate-binding protein